MEQSVTSKALPPSKRRRLTFVKKNTDPVEEKPTTAIVNTAHPLSEEAIVSAAAAAKAASDEQLWQAIKYKNWAVDCMACNNVVGIKAVLVALEAWDPSPAALRTSGFPIVFHDIKFWEDAKVSDRASALRSKFRKVYEGRSSQ